MLSNDTKEIFIIFLILSTKLSQEYLLLILTEKSFFNFLPALILSLFFILLSIFFLLLFGFNFNLSFIYSFFVFILLMQEINLAFISLLICIFLNIRTNFFFQKRFLCLYFYPCFKISSGFRSWFNSNNYSSKIICIIIIFII